MTVTAADEKAAAAISQVSVVNGELCKVAEKRNEFECRLRKVETESGCRLIRFNILLVKQAGMDKVLHSVIEQSVSVLDGFINRTGGEIVNSF